MSGPRETLMRHVGDGSVPAAPVDVAHTSDAATRQRHEPATTQ